MTRRTRIGSGARVRTLVGNHTVTLCDRDVRPLHVRGQRVDIVRAFRAAGAIALAADADELAPALYHADRRVLVPLVADPGYVDAIAALVHENDVRLVARSTTSTTRSLRGRGRQLEPAVLLLPDAEVCDRMSDKLEAHRSSPPTAFPHRAARLLTRYRTTHAIRSSSRRGAGSARVTSTARRRGAARLLPPLHGGRLLRAGALSRGGVLDRRLLRHGRALPQRDSADDDPVQGGESIKGMSIQDAELIEHGRRVAETVGSRAPPRAVLSGAGREPPDHGRQHASAEAFPCRSRPAAAIRSSLSRSRAASAGAAARRLRGGRRR